MVNRKGAMTQHVINHRQKGLSLDWDVLPYPPCSPNLAPSDYHLFLRLQNYLNEKTFTDKKAVKSHLENLFADKSQTLYERGFMKLVER